ncbi:hypothetical protein, partial [Chryseobacterium sp. RR2-3-20]|uniref:hypothetical protein n=1 Tax=Chryseobacterium sp. RR2-3-20 TaxID=2787626 RepID=UPI001ADF4F40
FFFTHSKSWSLFRSVIFDAISHNGKSICEGRAKNERMFNFRPNEAAIFSMKLNYKNNVEWKNSGG